MNKKKILKLLLMSLTSATSLQTLDVHAEITKESVLESAREDAKCGKVEVGTVIYERDEENKIETKHTYTTHNIKLRDIVTVSGRGVSSSLGTGNKTMKYSNEVMAVVGVKEDMQCPYALAGIDQNGNLLDVVGWFKKENIESVLSTIKITEYAPIEKDIVDISAVATEEVTYYDEEEKKYVKKYTIPLSSGYEWLGKDHAIRVKYNFKELESKGYDLVSHRNLPDNIESYIYKNKDKEITYYHDNLDGTYWHFKEKRTRVEEGKKLLKKRYNIKNS